MWPWSKFKQYEVEIEKLKSELKLAQQTARRLTDRDSKGRFKK